MPKNTFTALIMAIGGGILSGILALTLVAFLLSGFYHPYPDDFLSSESIGIILSGILCLALPFVIGIGFLLPLAGIERKKIELFSKDQLLIRYLPIVTIPFGVLFLFLIFPSFSDTNDRFCFMTIGFTSYSISCSSLWLFVKKLKS